MAVSTGVWDYRIEGADITVHSAERQLGLELTLLPNGISVRRSMVLVPPHQIVIVPDHILAMSPNGHTTLKEMHFSECQIGFVIS